MRRVMMLRTRMKRTVMTWSVWRFEDPQIRAVDGERRSDADSTSTASRARSKWLVNFAIVNLTETLDRPQF